MKKKLFLLPLLALLLGACSPEANEDATSTQKPTEGNVTLSTATPEQGGSSDTDKTPDGGDEGGNQPGGNEGGESGGETEGGGTEGGDEGGNQPGGNEGGESGGETEGGGTEGGEGEGGGETTPAVTGITITPASAKILLGKTQKFTATLQPEGATGTVTWSIVEVGKESKKNDEPRVTIAEDGTVTVHKFAKVGTGNYQVKATCGEISQTADIEVTDFEHGSLENPISVKEALNIIEWDPYDNNKVDAYTKAYITTNTIKDSENKIDGYVANDEDGQAIYLRDISFAEGLVGGVTPNDLSGKEVIIKSTLRYETNSKKNEFNRGQIVSIKDAVGTETPTKLVLDKTEGTVTSVAPLQIYSYMLPMPAKGEIVWTVDPAITGVSVTNGKVETTAVVKDGTKATIKATIKGTEISQSVAVTVSNPINYGTLEAPLTPTQANALFTKHGAEGLSENLFVKGKVSEWSNSYQNKWNGAITDGTESFGFYQMVVEEDLGGKSLLDREIIITGKANVHNNENQIKEGTLARLIPLPQATTFDLDKTEATLSIGEDTKITASFPEGTEGKIEWTSSSDKVSVTKGLVKVLEGATKGDVTITAKLVGTEITKTVTIHVNDVKITTATFDCTVQPENFKSGMQFEATLENAKITTTDGTNTQNTFSWYSGDVRGYSGNTMKIVPAEGVVITTITCKTTKGGNWVKTIDNGTAEYESGTLTIVPEDGRKEINIVVGVSMKIEDIVVTSVPPMAATDFTVPATDNVIVGRTYQVTPTLVPTYGEGSFTYEILAADASKASVNETGLVTLTSTAKENDTVTVIVKLTGTDKTHNIVLTVVPVQEATYELDCTKAEVTSKDKTFDFGGTNNDQIHVSNTGSSDGVKFGGGLKIAQNDKYKFTTVEGFEFKTITLTCSQLMSNTKIKVEGGTFVKSDKVITITVTDASKLSITVTSGKQVIVSKLSVFVAAAI